MIQMFDFTQLSTNTITRSHQLSLLNESKLGRTSLYNHDQHITNTSHDTSVVHVYPFELPCSPTPNKANTTNPGSSENGYLAACACTCCLLPWISFVQCRAPWHARSLAPQCAGLSDDMNCTPRDGEPAERLSSKFSSRILSQWSWRNTPSLRWTCSLPSVSFSESFTPWSDNWSNIAPVKGSSDEGHRPLPLIALHSRNFHLGLRKVSHNKPDHWAGGWHEWDQSPS